jgi:hypothetical protein
MVNSSLSTTIDVTIVDENDDELVGYFVDAYRYNLAGDNYTLVDTRETNSQGQCQFNLIVTGNEFKFDVKTAVGDVIFTEPKQILISTEYTFRVVIGTTPELISLKVYNLNIDLGKSQDRRMFEVNWSEINISTTLLTFQTRQSNITGDLVLNPVTSTNNTGSLSYFLPALYNTSGHYITNVYVISRDDGLTYLVDSATIDIREEYELFGNEAMIMAFIFIGTMACIGIFMSPTAGILLAIVGMLAFTALGFLNIAFTGIMAIVVTLIIVMVRVKRR